MKLIVAAKKGGDDMKKLPCDDKIDPGFYQ
jgi:hypothetical protein